MVRQDGAVDHGRKTATDAALGQTLHSKVELVVGEFREVSLRCCGLSKLLSEGDAQGTSLLGQALSQRGTALHNGAFEETLGRRHSQQRRDLAATARLSANGHLGGVAAKAADVVAHPFEGLHDVLHTEIYAL